MWSILPAIYSKYFGLGVSSIAAVILAVRIFDGIADTVTGYLSDRHHAHGGSRRVWVIVGSIGTLVVCWKLFEPPSHVSELYYFAWSAAFFLVFTVAEIPHMTWGSELSMDYEQRSKIYGIRNIATRIGIVSFYALPLLPKYATHEYTPAVLRDAVVFGAALSAVGVVITLLWAPNTKVLVRDSAPMRIVWRTVTNNRPLLLYLVTFLCLGLSSGMWFGTVFFYLDGYLHVGSSLPTLFLSGYIIGTLSTPLWLLLIRRTSKVTAWSLSVALFIVQLGGMWFIQPGDFADSLVLVALANLYFAGHDIAALSILGDVIDYGRMKFGKDMGATYCALNLLVFKVGLGIGGGAALALAGTLGFSPKHAFQSDHAIRGLKIAFTLAPGSLALLGLALIVCMPITRRRHRVVQRRLEGQVARRYGKP